MENLISQIDQVFIDSTAKDSEVSTRLRQLIPSHKISYVTGRPYTETKGELSAHEFDRSKRQLYVTPFKGHFFKRCPGAKPGLTCCNYFVLNLGLQCNMNCSYCYLQSFINSPLMTIYSNIDQAIDELREMAKTGFKQKFRIGTGEVIDSLSLDPLTLYSHKLIEFFKEVPQWSLEFKTKSAAVDQFLNIPHAGNVIVSWSINPQSVIDQEEHGTASLEERLSAAEKCRQKGFAIAFHIDPIIWHPDWKTNYLNLAEELNQRFSPKDIPFISVGALRFQPEQKALMKERFGMNSWVNQAEMFMGKDGKLRYDQRLRSQMFETIVSRLKELDPRWNVFLCMETPESWLQSVQTMPRGLGGLDDLFDHRITQTHKAHKELNSSAPS